MPIPVNTPEHLRLAEVYDDAHGWRRWGPYVSDRSWATVREDYSVDGEAWDYLPFAHAHRKAYRWGEDGIGGVCDRYQTLVFAPAFWNGADPILKERFFGVTPRQANHGEDVKEYYFYLDSTPTHSYMRMLYKYPQRAFPYDRLVEENQRRGGKGFEYELLDTGIFGDNRYFDIFIEYVKADPEDLCIRIEAFNRGPDRATLHVIPHLWFRNTWAWTTPRGAEPRIGMVPSSQLFPADGGREQAIAIMADGSDLPPFPELSGEHSLGRRWLYAAAGGRPMFTNNETDIEIGGFGASGSSFTKDAFHRHIIGGEDTVNPGLCGTKAAVQYVCDVPAGGSVVLRLRLSDRELGDPLCDVDAIVTQRRAEADQFYEAIHPASATEDERRIQRQALAGLLWSKQIYLFHVDRWLNGDDAANAPPPERCKLRNAHWRHLRSMRILSMPDKWEYPWFAAWDLAFHCVTMTLVDPRFAKEQLWFLLFEQFQHPNGQIPAYEWEFSDINPPVHAWAVWRVYNMARVRTGKADREFLEKCFHKLLINFTWWINQVDSEGNNIFEGGFLGLDNITVVDRSVRCTQGEVLEQSDASGWMGMYCLNMMRIALELAKENRAYEALATKFFQHYIYVAAAMKHMGGRNYQLWDETDGFFYDVLRYPDGRFHKFRVRSLVGLIPLFAVERLEEQWLEPFKEFRACLDWFLRNREDLTKNVVHKLDRNGGCTLLLTICDPSQLARLLGRMWDTEEFLSEFGIRSLSKAHLHKPFDFGGSLVRYEPAESDSKIKGGNSNWRGPIWFPTCFLIIESLRKLAKALGGDFEIECQRTAERTTLNHMSADLAERMIRIFARDSSGKRPIFGGARPFQEDPHWRDCLLFYEYFHGDNGAGLGASHQTGWTALVASLIDEWRA